MSNTTIMGWNQLVYIDTEVIKVSDYSVGVSQSFEVPQLITGVTDKITWSKALVEAGGTISAPLMQSFGNAVLARAFNRNTLGNLTPFTIGSSIHIELTGASMQTATISAASGEYIQVTGEVFGTAGNSGYIPYSGYGNFATGPNQTATAEIIDNTGNAVLSGFVSSPTYTDEQIPMFDQVFNVEDMMPESLGVPVNFELSVNNNLIRNYVLGSETGLDAWSISSGQRDLTGTVTWQSTTTGAIGQVLNAGLVDPGTVQLLIGPITIDLTSAYVLWGAQPPAINPNDRVTASAPFQIINSTYGFIPISVS